MVEYVRKALEYDKVLSIVSGYAQSERGKRNVMALEPQSELSSAQLLNKQCEEAFLLMNNYNVHPNFSVDDSTESILLAQKGSILSIPELLAVARLIRISGEVKVQLTRSREEFPILYSIALTIYNADLLSEQIERSMLNEEELSDYASVDLARIRGLIRRANERLKEKLQTLISGKKYAEYLQDNIVTKRGDRYVIPVRNEYRSYVKGIIHDQSQSGQTVFIEPQEIVDMNNELRQLKIDEAREIERILRTLSSSVGSISSELITNITAVAHLDEIFARGYFARQYRCICPNLNDKGIIEINKGRHPLISESKVVPVTIRLGKDFDILLITGPNTGGKTVSLKLTGLFTLMAMTGIFIPCEEGSTLSVFDNVFCDVGDEQSIEQSLSTFSSHMKNVVSIVDMVNNSSLVLLDELGAGTDPEQGAALAVAITDELLASGAKCIITTHYSPLKEYSYVTERVENASMDFNPETFEPTYRLIIGVPGTSNALEISRMLGLSEKIVNKAKQGIAREKQTFEEVLQSADQTRRIAEEKKHESERLNYQLSAEIDKYRNLQAKLENQIDRLNQDAKKEVKRLVGDALDEVNEIVAQLKKLLDNPTKASYFEATKLRKRMKEINVEKENEDRDIPELTEEAPKAGDLVYVFSLNDVATLETITKNGEYIIKIGNIKSIVKKKAVKRLKDQGWKKIKPEEKKKVVRYEHPTAKLNTVTSELNLIGKRVQPALDELEVFLNLCKERKIPSVRIIHGNGTGALRLAIWEFLDSQDVVSFRLGTREEGGSGATIVRL